VQAEPDQKQRRETEDASQNGEGAASCSSFASLLSPGASVSAIRPSSSNRPSE